jgi:hypothetical protein
MKTLSWILFGLAVVSFGVGVLNALFPFSILSLTPGGYLRISNTFLFFVIALYVLKKI